MVSSSASSSSPQRSRNQECRLTVHRPNVESNKLYKAVQLELYSNQSFFWKYWILLIFVGIGGILAIWIFFSGPPPEDDDDGDASASSSSSVNFKGAFFCLLIFGVFGGTCHCIGRRDASLHSVDRDSGINKARGLIREKLNARIRQTIDQKLTQQHQTALANLAHTPQGAMMLCGGGASNTTTTSGQMNAGNFLPYTQMDTAGCLPASLVVTYELAWTVLKDRYEHKNQYVSSVLPPPGARKILDLHDKWMTIVTKSVDIASAILTAIDNQRVKATQQAARASAGNAFGIGLEAIGGLGAMADMGKQIYDLKGQMDDFKEIYDNLPAGMQSVSMEPRTGIHPIIMPLVVMQITLSLVFMVPLIFLFAKQDNPAGTWGMVGVLLFLFAMCWYMQRGPNQSFNSLEDLVNLESYARGALQYEMEKHLQKQQQHHCNDMRVLVTATNTLRDLLLEGYYDTLGIHCQTTLMSFGTHPGHNSKSAPLLYRAAPTGGVGTILPTPGGAAVSSGAPADTSNNKNNDDAPRPMIIEYGDTDAITMDVGMPAGSSAITQIGNVDAFSVKAPAPSAYYAGERRQHLEDVRGGNADTTGPSDSLAPPPRRGPEDIVGDNEAFSLTPPTRTIDDTPGDIEYGSA